MDAFVQLSYATEIAAMASHKRGAHVPLASEIPATLYPATDAYVRLGLAARGEAEAAKEKRGSK